MSTVLYVAGPYRGDVARNIFSAMAGALRLWDAGHVALCPHLNTAWFDEARPSVPDATWLDGDLELMRRCDGVATLPGWQDSAGAQAEVAEARRVGIPVRSLDDWIADGQARTCAETDKPASPAWGGGAAHQPPRAAAADPRDGTAAVAVACSS